MTERRCTYHCRCCGEHFTSLAAFDAHGPRFASAGGCEWPDDAPLVELEGGTCTIGDPDNPVIGITLYEHADAGRVREYHRGIESAQTLRTGRKLGLAA
jgi:hypothetical protein